MCTIDDTIRQILSSCRSEPRASTQDKHGPILLDLHEEYEVDTKEKLETNMRKFMDDQKVNFSVVEYASINKMLALCSLTANKVLEGTCHLMEAHANSLRQQVLHRFTKTKTRIQYQGRSMIYGLDPYHVKYDMKNTWNCKSLKNKLAELPPEWHVIQVTSQCENFADYKHNEYAGNFLYTLRPTHPIHISIFPTGPNAIEPFCLTLPKPISNTSYDLRKEIESILNKNKSNLLHYDRTKYWEMRNRQDIQMKTAITELEESWLREWRILFMAGFIENLEVVKNVHQTIDKLINDSKISKEIPNSSRWLLKKVAEGSCYLSKEELSKAVKYILPYNQKLAKNIVLSVHGMMSAIETLKSSKRKNLILILDEDMDHIPFEAMEILKHHPVSRLASIHFTYALYMEHRDSIVNGCKEIELSASVGSFIVNPSCDLIKMEKRLKVFIDYWLPDWKGLYGTEPDTNRFKSALVDHDILMYAGHGSGIQYMKVQDIEKLRVKAIVLLLGCSSLKLTPVGGRQPPFGVANQYITASSPCNMGMLWEVTDSDCDRLTVTFMSNWIPSKNRTPFQNIDFNEWENGIIVSNEKSEEAQPVEFEMLRAIAKAKNACKQYMTAAAVVIRGLPVRIIQV